jgi:hypothetical protein
LNLNEASGEQEEEYKDKDNEYANPRGGEI